MLSLEEKFKIIMVAYLISLNRTYEQFHTSKFGYSGKNIMIYLKKINLQQSENNSKAPDELMTNNDEF